MIKAEDRARDLGYGTDPLNRAEYTANEVRDAFIEGYEQAEKDLALTWQDMNELYIIFAQVDVEIEFGEIDVKADTVGYYQEALKRFNERRH